MLEYICATNLDPGFDRSGSPLERIVRCKDCKYYYEAENYHPSGNYVMRCCKYFDAYNDEVEPNGFCAWGEPKQAESTGREFYNGPKAMNNAERAAMKALMRGVAILMRFASWQMLGKFDQRRDGGPKRRQKWALVLKDEASAIFREAGRL